MSIGQGNLLVSPLQQAVAYSAIENGGKVVTPHVGEAHPRARPTTQIVPGGRDRAAGRCATCTCPPSLLTEIKQGLYGATHAGDGTSTATFGELPADRLRQDGHRRGADHDLPELRRRLVGGLGVAGRQVARRRGVHPQRRPRRRLGRAGRRRACSRRSSHRSQQFAFTRRVGPVAMTPLPAPPRLPDARDGALDLGVRPVDHADGDQELRRQPVRPPAALRRRRHGRHARGRRGPAGADAAGALAALRVRAAQHGRRARRPGTSVGGGTPLDQPGRVPVPAVGVREAAADRRPGGGAGRPPRRHRRRPG